MLGRQWDQTQADRTRPFQMTMLLHFSFEHTTSFPGVAFRLPRSDQEEADGVVPGGVEHQLVGVEPIAVLSDLEFVQFHPTAIATGAGMRSQ